MSVSPRRIRPIVLGVAFAAAPWVTLGLGTPLAFGFATAVLRSRLLGVATAVYTAAVVGMVNLHYPEDQPYYGMFMSVALILGGVHAVVASPRLIRRLRHGHDYPGGAGRSRAAEAADLATTITVQERAALLSDPALRSVLRQRERRRQSREILASDPALAAVLGIGRPDQRPEFDDGGLVDINHVPASVLAELPGFDPAMADRVVSARDRFDGLRSDADLVVHADVPPEVVARLSDRLLFRTS